MLQCEQLRDYLMVQCKIHVLQGYLQHHWPILGQGLPGFELLC